MKSSSTGAKRNCLLTGRSEALSKLLTVWGLKQGFKNCIRTSIANVEEYEYLQTD